MNPDQLFETTMNPDTRRVLPLFIEPGKNEETLRIFQRCLGRKDVQARREWLETEGNLAEADI
jgi:topoisomerase-4 subunit B